MAKIKKRKVGGNTKKLPTIDASFANPNSIVEQQKRALKDYKYQRQVKVRHDISGPHAGAVPMTGRIAAVNIKYRPGMSNTAPSKTRSIKKTVKRRTK